MIFLDRASYRNEPRGNEATGEGERATREASKGAYWKGAAQERQMYTGFARCAQWTVILKGQ